MTMNRKLAAGLSISLMLIATASAQDAKPKIKGGYAIHNTVDLGGHIAEQSGSTAMYDTLVNIQSGPRVLGQTLEMHAVTETGKKQHLHLFDSLYASSNGFGGDPLNYISLRASKGKLYDFNGNFRRDRQYFDYNLLANNMVPSGSAAPVSNGYTFPQQMDSPHLYNTVRRMTDLSLTLFPVSKYSVRLAYSKNLMQGPSYTAYHGNVDVMLLQNVRNSTDSYTAGLDWKPFSRTIVTLQEDITHYKGDTSDVMSTAGLLGLNGASTFTPVSLGNDIVLTVPTCKAYPTSTSSTAPIIAGTTFTVNPTCSGVTGYTRSAPTRTLIPTESLRFVSANIPKLHLNGNVRYTSTTMNLSNYAESMTGLTSAIRVKNYSAFANAQRINVAAQFGAVYEISPRFTLTEQFEFTTFRQPAEVTLTENDYNDSLGTGTAANPYSMLNPVSSTPTATSPIITNAFLALNQRTETNVAGVAWQASPRATFSLSYRYRARYMNKGEITGTGAAPLSTSVPKDTYTMYFNENGGIFGADFRPSNKLSLNGGIEVNYADNTFVQTSPRATQHYKLRATYKPREWASIFGSFNDLEHRNNIARVNHLDHSRSYSGGASLAPSERYSLDFNYAYQDVFSQTSLCFLTSGAPPAGAVLLTTVPGTSCVATSGTTIAYFGTGYYDAPTQSGSIGITLVPVKKVRTSFGYSANSTGGSTETLNPRDVPGSLQSQFMTPYAKVSLALTPTWIWKADWNYYGYNEQGAPVGPTAPRDFHGNVVTLGMHYEF
ncbi:MAG: hypothetical protein P4L10_07645 [Acidobacteriaceae bacterium]|nr:hypothetical protein [Acidobacteriaceae bacterium]